MIRQGYILYFLEQPQENNKSMYVLNNIALKYIKKNAKLKGEMGKFVIIVENSNIFLLTVDR